MSQLHIDDTLLASHIQNFYGYGNWQAALWFVGIGKSFLEAS